MQNTATNETDKEASTPSSDLSPKQERALIALIESGTTREAAKRVGTNETTIWRWMQDPVFQKRYREARRQVVEAAIAKIQHTTDEAVDTLRRNLNCGNSSDENRAASILIRHSIDAVTLVDLQERVEELERVADAAREPNQ